MFIKSNPGGFLIDLNGNDIGLNCPGKDMLRAIPA